MPAQMNLTGTHHSQTSTLTTRLPPFGHQSHTMENTPTPSWTDAVVKLMTEHIAWTEPLVFALGFAESTVFLSLLIPSTVLFLAIGGAHSAVGGIFWPVWLAGATGAFLGDLMSYALGRYLKKDILRIWPLRTNPHWVDFARRRVLDYGVAGVIASKFIGMARPFVPVIAGSLEMAWPRFVFASALSSLIWAGVFLAPGYGIAWFMTT